MDNNIYEIYLEKFAQRFSELLTEHHSDINFLVNQLGVSKSTISRYLNAKMTPKLTTIKVLADIYNVNPAWLMGYDVSKNSTVETYAKNYINNIEELKSVMLASYKGLDLEGLSDEAIKDVEEYIKFKKEQEKNKK